VFIEKLRLDEGIDVPLDKLIDIAEREAERDPGGVPPRRPAGSGRRSARDVAGDEGGSPGRGQGRRRGARAGAGAAGVRGARRVRLGAEHDPIHIGPTPPFCRWTFATSGAGPVRGQGRPGELLPDRGRAGWTPERQEQHLRDFNRPTLGAISMHEVYPGTTCTSSTSGRSTPKLRKSLMTMPMSVVEGWAHYAEHLAVESGFDLYGPATKLGQLAETLVRLARLVVAIRLHTEDWSVEQGVRFFREAAFLEEGSARKEAERGTFDPGYGVYALGKLILMKLRKDAQAQQGQRFSLKAFHDSVLALGGLRYPLQREALLGPEAGALRE
jgi:hypothetical protein